MKTDRPIQAGSISSPHQRAPAIVGKAKEPGTGNPSSSRPRVGAASASLVDAMGQRPPAEHTGEAFGVPMNYPVGQPAQLKLAPLTNSAQSAAESDTSAPRATRAKKTRKVAAGGKAEVARAIPEYKSGQSVLISYLLFSFEKHGADLVKAILDAGAPHVYMVAPQDKSDPVLIDALAKLRGALGNKMDAVVLVPIKTEGASPEDPSVWARDWAPLTVAGSDGTVSLVDFEYYSNRPIDDGCPGALAKLLKMRRTEAPLRLEGGNFMIDSRGNCFSTMRAVYENRPQMSEQEVKDAMKKALGCQSVTLFPTGIDSTYHIDLWAKLVGDDTVIVNEVWDDTIKAAGDDAGLAQQMVFDRDYLNERAAEFVKLGYKVLRTPMPVAFQKYGTEIVRSYTNSLIVNSTAIVPSFRGGQFQFGDLALEDRYEKAVADAYGKAGLKVKFVDASDLVMARGALHCATMQLAESSPSPR